MTDRATIDAQLDSDDAEERRNAAAEIAQVEGDDAVRLLLRAMADTDWRVRKQAAETAVAIGPTPMLLGALVGLFEPGDDVGLRNAAVEALGSLGSRAIDALAAAVPRLDADGRKLAVDALTRSEDAEALRVLAILAGDPDPNVRAAAVEGVASVGAAAHDQAAPILERCLDSEDTHVRLAALEGLNRLEVPVRWERLARLVDDPVLASPALIAAGRSASSDAAPVLVRKLDETDGSPWRAAARALAGLARLGSASRADVMAALGGLSRAGADKILAHAKDREHQDTARSALVLAALIGTDEAAGVAASALADDRLAGDAEEALLLMGPAAIATLVRHIRAGRPDERAACLALVARIIGGNEDAGALEAVHDSLDDGAPEVVRAALGALAQIGDESSLGRIAANLDAKPPKALVHALEGALQAVAGRHGVAAAALVRSAVRAGSATHAAVIALGALDGPILGTAADDVGFLSQALTNTVPEVRRAAVDALAALSVEDAIEPVAFALTDEERDVRLAAVRALGRIRTDEGAPGVERLIALLATPGDVTLVAAAIRALGDTGSPRALSELRPIARSGAPLAAVSAVEALATLDTPKRVDALLDALGHGDAEVVKAALRALSTQADQRVVGRVAACSDHPAWDVRRLAADLLGRAGGPVAESVLRAKLSSEPEALVKDALQRALTELENEGGKRRTVPPPGTGRWGP